MGCDLVIFSSIASLIQITIDTMSDNASISASHLQYVNFQNYPYQLSTKIVGVGALLLPLPTPLTQDSPGVS